MMRTPQDATEAGSGQGDSIVVTLVAVRVKVVKVVDVVVSKFVCVEVATSVVDTVTVTIGVGA